MECLHGKPPLATTTKNGLFWYCGSKPSCQFFCPQKDRDIFGRAIASFQARGCPQPVCHAHQRSAKMRGVKDNSKRNGGSPFFVCSDRNNSCSFWQWGDAVESPTPICCHVVASCIRKVKREGPNQGRLFYCCPNEIENACEFFEWKPVENLPPVYKIGCLFSSPPLLYGRRYRYMIAHIGETFASRKTDSKEA